ncbi:FxSxx-COOH cyclophane-containing RiPP peptide [Parafrankia discariae]|uniref:FxSxx-COOH cyclophane-containing RiPP peptide n=1 Tax=Parafrankia discariae TaxID=365528 RepID=UPI0003684A4B|nr:FxSxx-COOH cyclophane-containing RiPP peptide [Parafrankia discariae]
MGDGPIEIESALPDLHDLDLDALDSLEIPALTRATERLRKEAAGPDKSLAGFSSSAQ